MNTSTSPSDPLLRRNAAREPASASGRLIAALLGSALLGWFPDARAAELGVPADFATIQAAILAAEPGDSVLVEPGVYRESLLFDGKDVRVMSREGPETTVLDAGGRYAAQLGPAGSLVGFTVTNYAFNAAAVTVTGEGTRVAGNVFEASVGSELPRTAVLLGLFASPAIEGNRFRGHTCSSGPSTGVIVFTSASSPVIRNNVLEDNECVALNMTSPFAAAPLVANNTFVGNHVAIRVDRRVSAASQTYRNNLIHDNGLGLALEFGSEADNPTWEHNLVFGNGVDHNEDPDPTGALRNIAADPMLMDAANGDYRPMHGSPALDAGSDEGAPADDFEGTERPLDGDGDGEAWVDIGAFEREAPEPEVIRAEIDIKPRSRRNVINPRGLGAIPVVLFGSPQLDVREVERLRFGPAGARPRHRGPHYFDVDGDGWLDLVARFRTQETGIARGAGEACVTAEIAGQTLVGCDDISIMRNWQSRSWRRMFHRR